MFHNSTIISVIFISFFPFILYWLSLIYSIFFSNVGKNSISREFYECGFKSINDNNSVIDIKFSVICLVFLIYEMEIVLFVPILLNYNGLSFLFIILILFSLLIIFLSYLYEIETYSLSYLY